MSRQRGFTLIEVMITVAIIGILAAIAYPSYRQSVLESRRTDGYAALLECAQAQERYYTAENSYATQAAADAATPAFCQDSDEGYYAVAVTNPSCGTGTAPRTCFLASATATSKGGQDDDQDCKVLTLNQLGQKGSKDADGNASSGCWVN